jgi:hypothetical protein
LAEVVAGLAELVEKGKQFTFQNFASKGSQGYPNAYSDEWLVWTHHINSVIGKFGQSPIANSVARGLQIELLG